MNEIPFNEFNFPSHYWNTRNLLLTAGDYTSGKYNCMTVGWGSFGFVWRRPFVQVFVRPTRYTYQFINDFDTFTLTGFTLKEKTGILNLLGTKSGREGDKIAEAGITPVASQKVAAPSYKEAILSVECTKIYWEDILEKQLLQPGILENYPLKDFHRIYFGEILRIVGEEEFRIS
jgi:flavin reductase (DIM6/NTAB) family NADH-FMN oxidoreductase RutF